MKAVEEDIRLRLLGCHHHPLPQQPEAALPIDVLRLTAAPLVKSYEITAPYEWATGAVPLPLFAIAVLVRLLVSPFLWPCIHIFAPSAHISFHVLRLGSWLVCIEWFGLLPRAYILSRRHPSSMFSC